MDVVKIVKENKGSCGCFVLYRHLSCKIGLVQVGELVVVKFVFLLLIIFMDILHIKCRTVMHHFALLGL